MTSRTAARSLLALALAGVLTACGGGDGDSDTASEAEASPSALSCPLTAEEVPAPEGATADLATKPVVAKGTAPAPTELQYADIVEGDGEQAQTGDQVTVKYVGAIYETGTEFDSSWSRGAEETFPFGICRQGVVPGFAVGPTGMKVGGRRQITIPPNSTLVFVVDLVEVDPEGE